MQCATNGPNSDTTVSAYGIDQPQGHQHRNGRQMGGGVVPVDVGPGFVGLGVEELVDVGGVVVVGFVVCVEVELGSAGAVEVGRSTAVDVGAGEVRPGRVAGAVFSDGGGASTGAEVGALVDVALVVDEVSEVRERVEEELVPCVAPSALADVTAGDDADLAMLDVAAADVAPEPLWARAYAEQVPATITAAAVPMVASLRLCPPPWIHFSQKAPPATWVACPAAVAQAMPGPRASTAGSRMPPRSRSTATRSASRRSQAGQSSTWRCTSGASAAAPGSNSTRRGTKGAHSGATPCVEACARM